MKIVIRADSGAIMGSGHIMRCLVLADELRVQTTFACRNLPGNIISVIESRGYAVKILPESFEDANKEFLNFLAQEKPETIIFDNYDIDVELESAARQYVQRIVVIDDLAKRKHDCDILLDQNPCEAIHIKYDNLVPNSAIKLLGLKYALLGREFSLRHCERSATTHTGTQKTLEDFIKPYGLPSFANDSEVKNILIFFGGGDHKNLTEKVLNVFKNQKSRSSIISNPSILDSNFTVIVGGSNPNKEKIRALCEDNKNFSFHCQINNMAELMQASDLFIGAGGTTSWERMCGGLPGIIISIAENQEEICKELAGLDLIKYLGTAEEFSEERFLQTLEWVFKNPEWINTAAIKGQEMVDGYGAKHVANIISITFHDATEDDCENIFNWRNADENRRYSINNDKIIFENHKKWFSKMITDKNHKLLITNYNNKAIAVIRFDYSETEAEISLYLVPGEHGKGFGLPLLLAAEGWLRKNQKNILEINAKVIAENIASIKIFKYALYKEIEANKNILFFRKSLK